MKNQILEAIYHIKSIGEKIEKIPTPEKNLNHISKTQAANIDLSFKNETIPRGDPNIDFRTQCVMMTQTR